MAFDDEPDGQGGVATASAPASDDWVNDPEFKALPLEEKHKAMLELEPEYKALPGSEKVKALTEIHYGPEPSKNPNTGYAAGLKAGAGAAPPPTESFKESMKTGLKTGLAASIPGYGLAKNLYEAATGAPAHAKEGYKTAKDLGYDPVSAGITGAAYAAGPAVGVNPDSMEERSKRGDTAGILGEATVPTAMAVAPLAAEGAGLAVGKAKGALDTALEPARVKGGTENIIKALDTPAGKGGKKAADMQRNVQTAKGDLAEIQRTNPVKGKGAQAHHDLAEAIEDRQDTLWEQGHTPGIERHAETPIDHQKLVSAAKTVVSDEARDAAPGEADAVDKWIEKSLNKERTLQSTDKFIREINDDLKGKDADTRYGPLQVRARQAVVAAARQEVEDKLIAAGEQGVKGVNQRYGAMGAIKDRLREKAVQLARSEAKDGKVPDWVKTYAFLHPTTGLVAGVGLDLAKMAGKPSNLKSGMRQLGRTSLDAPIHDIPPPGWKAPGPATWGGQPPSVSNKLLPAPEPPATELPNGPDTSGSVNDPTARWSNPKGLLKPPVRGLLPAPRVEGNAPGAAQVSNPGQFPPEVQGLPAASNVQRGASGRMSRVSLGTPEPGVIGHTAEGGDIYSPAEPAPQRAPRPTERREEMNQTRVSPTGEERRDNPPAESDPHSASRTAIVKVLNEVMDDTQATAAQKAKAKTELADIQKGAKTRAQKGAREEGVKGGDEEEKDRFADSKSFSSEFEKKNSQRKIKNTNGSYFLNEDGKSIGGPGKGHTQLLPEKYKTREGLTPGQALVRQVDVEAHMKESGDVRVMHSGDTLAVQSIKKLTPDQVSQIAKVAKDNDLTLKFDLPNTLESNGSVGDFIRAANKEPSKEAAKLEEKRGTRRDLGGPDEERTTRMQSLRGQLKDPSLSDRDKGLLEAQLQDLKDHPFEMNEIGSNLKAFKKEKLMTEDEAKAETEKRKKGRNERFKEKK
jgi:hypothetical protein